MTDVTYLECISDDMPAHTAWLTEAERDVLGGFRFAKRRGDWLLGRWCAKQAVAAWCDEADRSHDRIEILADEDGVPEVSVDGEPLRVTVSLSHSNGRAIFAIAPRAGVLGCDVEKAEPRDPSFAETFLTGAEQAALREATPGERDVLATFFWSAKESALKATHEGLGIDTRRIEIEAPASVAQDSWQRWRAVDAVADRAFCGWWRLDGEFVKTMAADRPMQAPRRLEPAGAPRPVTDRGASFAIGERKI